VLDDLPMSTDLVQLHFEVESFLVREADILDAWRLNDWLELFTADAVYVMPATDHPDGDPARDLCLVYDDMGRLNDRVASLLGPAAHAERPLSRTRRMVSNFRIDEVSEQGIRVRANFIIHRSRRGSVNVYFGEYRHHLVRDDDGRLRFKQRVAVIDTDTLRVQTKISIIV
jgi:p-cumate 2,3-dioxygenase beta subunit